MGQQGHRASEHPSPPGTDETPAEPLVVVANRLPIDVGPNGEIRPSPGGLTSALRSVTKPGTHWVGWPGSGAGLSGPLEYGGFILHPLMMTRAEVNGYYHGFCNSLLWPLFHGRLQQLEFTRSWWRAYRAVNQHFATTAAAIAPRDGIVWVHDYHLLLAPAMIRARRPDLRIGLFLHIPFPNVQLFATLPWRRELLLGMVDANLIGFQTEPDVGNFVDAADQLAGHRWQRNRGRGLVEVDAFPISVDVTHWTAVGAAAGAAGRQNRQMLGVRHVFLGIDRLDYTKGITQRLQAFAELLEDGQLDPADCTFVQVAVPSRTPVPAYQEIRAEVEALVIRVNARYRRADGSGPVHYIAEQLDEPTLAGWYRAADTLVVTSLADGMNLVAKEFVASRPDLDAAIVISEFAGAANDLPGAWVVNPYDVEAIKRAMLHAVRAERAERHERMRTMRASVRSNDVHHWATGFLDRLQPGYVA